MRNLCNVTTQVEEFWGYYSHLIRPNELPNTSDYHLFKDGIKPMWEVCLDNNAAAHKTILKDDANKNGGKWILRLKKGQASRYWEDLVSAQRNKIFLVTHSHFVGKILAVIGEQFEVGNEICGAVVSIRYQEDILSVWNRNATDSEVKARILETMKRVLPLDGSPRFEYKNHDASIRDNSSFRNTDSLATPPGPSPSYTMRRDSRDRGDKGERERYERGEKGERSERYDRTDKGDRYDREKGDRGDRFEKSERGDRFDREKGERGDRYDRGDRFERGDRGDRDRPEKGDSKSDKLDWTDKSDPSLEVLLEEHTTPDKKLNMDSNSNR